MAIRTGTFNGASVFLSRNLVPPELYDSVHDALWLNGAQVFLCSDPSRTSANDYHVISSPNHEKFQDLKAKGCNLIGPHCILSCARERRALPKQVYTCCLAMDGVKILASGFEKEEKIKIEQFVTAMGGVLHSRTSLDICFVVVKNVLAAKYKWALNALKKPIVNMSWLNQCWAEHRLVPHESYRILPFTGLTICVTKVPLDERKEMERLILQNGGIYSGDLTKKCTHLVSDISFHYYITHSSSFLIRVHNSPSISINVKFCFFRAKVFFNLFSYPLSWVMQWISDGDKYMVAKRWGHISIVTRRWVDQSVSRKACLDEGRYPVHGSSSCNDIKNEVKEQCSQEYSYATSQSIPLNMLQDLEPSVSENISSTFCDATAAVKNSSKVLSPLKDEAKFEQSVAEDSEDEGNDLYLSDCRIILIGFEGMELRRLVSMIRNGGGTRHMLLSEKLTHIIVGSPSEIEKKEVRQLAALGLINVVKSVWLEDCDRVKKELPVSQKHIASELFCPKDSISSSGVPSTGFTDTKEGKSFPNCEEGSAFGKVRRREEPEFNLQESSLSEMKTKSKQNNQPSSVNIDNHGAHSLHDDSELGTQRSSLNIFKGHSFCFSKTFPGDRRDDIIEWVGQGGGLMVNDAKKARFIIECHGLHANHANVSQSTMVSSHWIRSCLEEKCIQDVESHIIYKPLRCRVPLPGFEGFRFCVSQYETKERQLLRNLCFILGSKYTEKLTKKITHLLCKFTSGLKYETACKWGIHSVTAEWIMECIRQDMMISLDPFRPKAVTSQDKEAGLCITSQYPTQAAGLISEETQSQLLTGPQTTSAALEFNIHSTILGKRSRFSEKGLLDKLSSKTRLVEDLSEASNAVPDIAAAIEDILEQSNKIQDLQLRGGNDCNRISDDAIRGQGLGITNQWSDRAERYFDHHNPCDNDGKIRIADAFSETQTESQVVGYEEDLSGRQKIIDRVRSQSLTLTPDAK